MSRIQAVIIDIVPTTLNNVVNTRDGLGGREAHRLVIER